MYRIEFEITGKRIHKAGFRSAVEDIAMDLGITGRAENHEEIDRTGLKVYSVHVLAEGNEESLKSFVERIDSINDFHMVDKIDAGSTFSSGQRITKREYPEFVIIRGENEIAERMDEAVYYMKYSHREMKKIERGTSQIPDLKSETHGMKEEMHGMREETNRNFGVMEGKYHKISDNLNFFVDIVAEYAGLTNPLLKERIKEIKKQYNKH